MLAVFATDKRKKKKELTEIERSHAPKALRSQCKRYKRQALCFNIKATVRHFWQIPAGMRGMTTTLWMTENKPGHLVTQAGRERSRRGRRDNVDIGAPLLSQQLMWFFFGLGHDGRLRLRVKRRALPL